MSRENISFVRKPNMSFRNIAAMFLAGIFCVLSSTTLAAELKVGFVNASKVLEQAPQAEQARGALEKEFSPRDKAMVKSQKEIRDLEDKLTRDGAIMSESQQRKLEHDIVSRKRDLKRDQDAFREDLNIRRNEAFDKLRKRVYQVIVDIAKKENYDLIVSDGVVFANDRIDITDKVVARLKEEFNQSKKNKAK
jgi:outer membrane protein